MLKTKRGQIQPVFLLFNIIFLIYENEKNDWAQDQCFTYAFMYVTVYVIMNKNDLNAILLK